MYSPWKSHCPDTVYFAHTLYTKYKDTFNWALYVRPIVVYFRWSSKGPCLHAYIRPRTFPLSHNSIKTGPQKAFFTSVYTGKIAACEFHMKLVCEIFTWISHVFHVKFVSCEFHVYCLFHVKIFMWISHAVILPVYLDTI